MVLCNREHYGYFPVPLRSHSSLLDESDSFLHTLLEVMGEPGGSRVKGVRECARIIFTLNLFLFSSWPFLPLSLSLFMLSLFFFTPFASFSLPKPNPWLRRNGEGPLERNNHLKHPQRRTLTACWNFNPLVRILPFSFYLTLDDRFPVFCMWNIYQY